MDTIYNVFEYHFIPFYVLELFQRKVVVVDTTYSSIL